MINLKSHTYSFLTNNKEYFKTMEKITLTTTLEAETNETEELITKCFYPEKYLPNFYRETLTSHRRKASNLKIIAGIKPLSIVSPFRMMSNRILHQNSQFHIMSSVNNSYRGVGMSMSTNIHFPLPDHSLY